MLCLANGERIGVGQGTRILFETDTILSASPATITRCGVVYMGEPVGWEAVVRSNVSRMLVGSLLKDDLQSELREHLSSLCIAYVPSVLSYLAAHPQTSGPLAMNGTQLASMFCSLLDGLLRETFREYLVSAVGGAPGMRPFLSRVFLYALVWGFGGSIVEDNTRLGFSDMLHTTLMKKRVENLGIPREWDMFSFIVDPVSGSCRHVSMEFQGVRAQPMSISPTQYLYPTLEFLQLRNLIALATACGVPLLIGGDAGVGKSAVVAHFLSGFGALPVQSRQSIDHRSSMSRVSFSSSTPAAPTAESVWMHESTQFCPSTTATDARGFISASLERKGNLLGPPLGKKMVLFVDDIGSPVVEPGTDGVQPALEVLRDAVAREGIYDSGLLRWMQLSSVAWVVSCRAGVRSTGASGTSGRNRVFAPFLKVHCAEPGETTQRTMFAAVLRSLAPRLSVSGDEHTGSLENAVSACVSLYHEVRGKFKVSPLQPQYTFNMRDLVHVFQSLGHVISSGGPLNGSSLSTLFVHETSRVFGDRLSDDTDRREFCDMIAGHLRTYFRFVVRT